MSDLTPDKPSFLEPHIERQREKWKKQKLAEEGKILQTVYHDVGEKTPLVQKNKISEAEKDQLLVKKRSSLIHERTKSIDEITEEFLLIHEIMEDLNRLTVEQTPYLESIETTVANSVEKTEQGANQLVKAEKHQKGKRKILAYTAAGGGTVIAAILIGLAAAKKSFFR